MTHDHPRRTTRPLVSLRSLDKRFDNGTLALRGLSLEIHEHEFLGVLGPSGCGKSTVLRLIAGLTTPSAGEIVWSDADRRCGFVFQDPTLMPWARVIDNVGLPPRLAGRRLASVREDASRALDAVGLSGLEQAWPHELSGGMRMRVSIARALVTRPGLLLMDEPFAALDEITRLRLADDLAALAAREAITVVFVTHSVYEAVALSHRIVVFTQRPGSVHDELAVDAPWPRDARFREGPEYAAICARVSAALRAATHSTEPATPFGRGAPGATP